MMYKLEDFKQWDGMYYMPHQVLDEYFWTDKETAQNMIDEMNAEMELVMWEDYSFGI